MSYIEFLNFVDVSQLEILEKLKGEILLTEGFNMIDWSFVLYLTHVTTFSRTSDYLFF